jgi:outer membrane protein assembly factor BamB
VCRLKRRWRAGYTAVSSVVLAIDGNSGAEIWKIPARNQMYGSPLFQNICADTTPEVFICGRDAQLYAINCASGCVVWEFWPVAKDSASKHDWYNFYNPQWVADQNNDGFKDSLVSNGGNAAANSQNEVRYAGMLMIVNALNGKVLYQDTMLDGRETYFSPLLVGDTILFGTGGEMKSGKLWMIHVDSFKQSG